MVGAAALAQSRHIPDDALRGYVRHVEGMTVTVDDKAMRLTAGATIRNRQNLIIVPMSLPRSGAWADYALDRNGQISSVWLLTAEELGRTRIPAR
jgi:hypothetical protein